MEKAIESINILLDRMQMTDQRMRVQRSELSGLFGSDRTARKLIEMAQYNGARIISGYGSGYWLAEDDGQYMAWRRRELARAYSILRKIRAMDNMTSEDNQQIGVTEYLDLIREAERMDADVLG